jgi:hypothetical protein
MSQLQVTTLESTSSLTANVITAGQTTVNSTGMFLLGSNATINTSSVKIIGKEIQGVGYANVTLSSVISTNSINLYRQLPQSDLNNWQNFSTAAANNWTTVNITISSSSDIPQGAITAFKLTESSSAVSNAYYIYYDNFFPYNTNIQPFNLGESFTCELLAKPAGRDCFYIQHYGEPVAFFNVANGHALSQSGSKANIVDFGNGWYKCTYTTSLTYTTNPVYNGLGPYIVLTTDSFNSSYNGDGSSGILVSSVKYYRNFTSLATESVNTQIFTVAGSNTWTKPSWATTGNELVIVHMWGGGGGAKFNTPGSGGGGGAFVFGYFKSSQVNATCNVVVGAGGAGNGTANATQGGNSIFYANTTNLLTAYGGGGARGGIDPPPAGGGGGWLSAGIIGTGGDPLGGASSGTPGDSTFGGGGGATTTSPTVGGSSVYGGGGGGRAGANGGASIFGGGGGGGSGGRSIFGGQGGSSSVTPPTTPGGGGGSSVTAGVSNGARGEVRVYTLRITG